MRQIVQFYFVVVAVVFVVVIVGAVVDGEDVCCNGYTSSFDIWIIEMHAGR